MDETPVEAAPPFEPKPDVKPLPIIIAIVVLVAAAGGLWYVLTRPAPETPFEGIATSTPSGTTAATTGYIRDSGEFYEIDASYPTSVPLNVTAGATAEAKAVALMKTFAEQEAARFKDSNVNALTAEDIEIQGIGGDRKYVLDADYDLHQSADTVSYVYHMYADTLGAHPNAYYRTFTFDKATGEAIILDDLFATEDYLDVLSNETRKRLRAQIAEASNIPESELDTEMLDAGTTPYADNFQNFYLEGNVLAIVFPPYQVGPWVIGTQEVRLTRAELGNTLKAKYR